MVVADPATAAKFLSHVNYYRFSGYCLAFETVRHQFPAGLTFEQVQASYDFDRVLRDLVTEALEIVEVDLRAAIAYHFGRRYGAFGHTNASHFFHRFHHSDWISKIHDETVRSKEPFVTHFRQSYREFPDLPIWIATEVMSFGAISMMFAGMDKKDQKAVAIRYSIQPHDLSTWAHHLVYVRNLCAHHARLWDHVWSIKPVLPHGAFWHPPYLPGNNRLFVTVLILYHLMRRCPSVASFASEWRGRVLTHLAHPPKAADPLACMGLTAQWMTHPLWR